MVEYNGLNILDFLSLEGTEDLASAGSHPSILEKVNPARVDDGIPQETPI